MNIYLHACVQIFLYRIKSNFVRGSHVLGDLMFEHSKWEAVHKVRYGLGS